MSTTVEVMDAIAEAIKSAKVTQRVYAWPQKEIAPPCAIVGYPQEMNFDAVFHDAVNIYTLPIYLLVGPVSDRATRAEFSKLLDGGAVVSLKQALDGHAAGVGEFRISSAKTIVTPVGAVDWLTLEFSMEVMS